jgi:hypothetical protein
VAAARKFDNLIIGCCKASWLLNVAVVEFVAAWRVKDCKNVPS